MLHSHREASPKMPPNIFIFFNDKFSTFSFLRSVVNAGNFLELYSHFPRTS